MKKKAGEKVSRRYLYVANIAGTGPKILAKMFAAQNLAPNATWIFAGNIVDGKDNNIMTINMVNNWVSQWHAVALWGPREVMLSDFINSRSDIWFDDLGKAYIKEALGGRVLDNINIARDLMQHQALILWLLNHLRRVYVSDHVIFARNGVYLNQDYSQTPLDFAVNATDSYWWSPGSKNFAYNQTGKLVVTSLDHPSEIYGTYYNSNGQVIHGPLSDQSFGIQYEQEQPRLILKRGTKYDVNSKVDLPIIYLIDDQQGLVGALWWLHEWVCIGTVKFGVGFC